MATILYSATMSLDGFIAGPGGDMSWLTESPASAWLPRSSTRSSCCSRRCCRGI
jgi:hypothetical protein